MRLMLLSRVRLRRRRGGVEVGLRELDADRWLSCERSLSSNSCTNLSGSVEVSSVVVGIKDDPR